MGGIFKAPKIDAVVDNSAQKTADEEAARKEALERQRRGMESNIYTSYQGAMAEGTDTLRRKKLLGE